ncbi:WD40 repeat-like protein [Wallemia mellicola]|nr:WD40 repeat-like protein [Wallemia mellicola]TIB87844.1 WD40 repeat-like protein [Wallemia mellicola]TIC40139.1 WD40 repeat-like protein [Wallemia mellicola]TIC42985.1 WD40 repeat-like protein [Wallemia mellicola]TIC48563.1 WD40 repeat-like protein [Wallemia mellicola]
MKIKAITRSQADGHPSDQKPPSRNPDPSMHPFAKQREYSRAVIASKMDRMFAKPFIGAIECGDGVYGMARDSARLGVVATSGAMGELAIHDVPTRQTLLSVPNAHQGIVSSLAFSHTSKSLRGDSRLLSAGLDKHVRMWDANRSTDAGDDAGLIDEEDATAEQKPLRTWTANAGVNCITHNLLHPTFATASNAIQVWEEARTEPVETYTWGHDNISALKFSPTEHTIMAAAAGDRSISLWDTRVAGGSIGRILTPFKMNDLSFNPILPTSLLSAGEDHNLYLWDIRNMGGGAIQIYKDHVAAVTSCDWSPTGQQIASGGWDRTVRIWDKNHGRSSDCYHTKRMQRLMNVQYSLDSKYVLTGSDDGNLRIWKARASEKIGQMDARERDRINYRDSLRERWSGVGEVRQVERRRNLPKAIRNASKLKKTMVDSQKTKEENSRLHTQAGQTKPKSEKKKSVIKEQTLFLIYSLVIIQPSTMSATTLPTLEEVIDKNLKRGRELFYKDLEFSLESGVDESAYVENSISYRYTNKHSNKAKLQSKLADEYKGAQNLPPSLAAQEGPRGKKSRKADAEDISAQTQKAIEGSTSRKPDEQSLILHKSFPKNVNESASTSTNGSSSIVNSYNNFEGTKLSQQLMKIKNQTQAKPDYHPQWKLMRVISGHLGWVRCVAVEPDNKWFATGAGDRTIKIWDLASGELKLSLTGHISTVRGLAVSNRHPYLFSCGEDKMVKCWDLESNKVIRHYHGHLSGVYAMAVHPTLDLLVTSGRDSVARVWDMRTRAPVHVLTGHKGTVGAVATQDADPQIITGSMDSTVKLWDLAAGADNGSMSFWDYKTGLPFQSMSDIPQPGSLDAEADKTIKMYKEVS